MSETFGKGDTVFWCAPEVNSLLFVESLARRYGVGPFTVAQVIPVPSPAGSVGHHQWVEIVLGGELLGADRNEGPQRFSGLWFTKESEKQFHPSFK